MPNRTDKTDTGDNNPRLKRRNVLVSLVKMWSNKEGQESKDAIEEKLEKRKNAPVAEVDLETPEQSNDDVANKTTESTPMPTKRGGRK